MAGAGHQTDMLAPEPLWRWCLQRGRAEAQGTSLDAVGEALSSVGQVTLTEWPYNSGLGAKTEEPPASCGDPPWRRSRWLEVPLAHDGSEDGLEGALGAGYPVVLVLEVTDEFLVPSQDGHITVPTIMAPAGDYHAVIIVGAATDGQHGRRLLVQNSWGPAWGAGGYGWLPVAYLVAFAVQAAVVIGDRDE